MTFEKVTKGGCEIPEALRGGGDDMYSARYHLGESDQMQPYCMLGNVWGGKGAGIHTGKVAKDKYCTLSLKLSRRNCQCSSQLLLH